MKLLAKLALAGSLALGTMSAVNTTYVNKQTVQAAKKDQGITIKSLMTHPRNKSHNKYTYVGIINWNPYRKAYKNKKVIDKQTPSDNDVGCAEDIDAIKKLKNTYYTRDVDNYSLMSDSNAPTIYTAKANVPVMAYRITKTWDDESGLVGMKDGKWHKVPINAGYISKGESRALLSKKIYI